MERRATISGGMDRKGTTRPMHSPYVAYNIMRSGKRGGTNSAQIWLTRGCGATRQRELAVRSALNASCNRLCHYRVWILMKDRRATEISRNENFSFSGRTTGNKRTICPRGRKSFLWYLLPAG